MNRKNKKAQKLTMLICLLVLLTSACGGCAPSPASQLGGEPFVLTSLEGRDPIEDRPATLRFEDDQVSGTTGCNNYGGGYQIEGESIRFEALFSTEMACLDPEGLMEQEQIYLQLLGAVDRFALQEGVLTFFSGERPVLSFEKQ